MIVKSDNDTENDIGMLKRSALLKDNDNSDAFTAIEIARSQRQGRKLKQRSAATPRIAPQEDLLDWVPPSPAPKDYTSGGVVAPSLRTVHKRPTALPKDDLSSSTHSMRSFTSNGTSDWIDEEEVELAIDSVHLTKRHRSPQDDLSGSFHSIHSTRSIGSSNSLGWVEEEDELTIDSMHLTKRHRRPHKEDLIGSSSSLHSVRSSFSIHELDWVEEDDELLVDSVHLTKSHCSNGQEGLIDKDSSLLAKRFQSHSTTPRTTTLRALLMHMESCDADEDGDESYSSDAIL